MKNIKANSPILLGAGLGVAALAVIGVIFGRVKDVDPPRVGFWSKSPVVCISSPEINRDEVVRAINWWRERCYDIQYAKYGTDCNGAGMIEVVLDPLIDQRTSIEDGEWNRELTRVSQDGDDQIIRAKIFVATPEEAIVYAHGIYHAIGYLHPKFPPSGHIGHPKNPGWDDRGIDKCGRKE